MKRIGILLALVTALMFALPAMASGDPDDDSPTKGTPTEEEVPADDAPSADLDGE